MDSRPRILAGRSDGVSSNSCPVVTVPAGSVPVTTVPLPLMLNDRSTQSRTGDGQRRHHLFQRIAQVRQAGAGDRADRHGRHGTQAGTGDVVERLAHRRPGIG
jgi:hypothetical protein